MNISMQTDETVKRIERPAVLDFEGDKLAISAEAALPPGSRVEISLPTESGSEPLSLAGKVVSSAPADNGSQRLVVRLHNVTRAQRSLLENLLRPGFVDRAGVRS